MRKNNQNGFSPIYLLLVILILLALGFIGWKVWERSKDAPASSSSTSESVDKDATTPEITYASPESELYRVSVPEAWVSGTCPDNVDILFLAPSTEKLGRCQSDSGGTVAIAKNTGNTGHTEEYYTSDDQFSSVSYSPVTIDGITGYKVSYTVATENELGYPPVGTKVVLYSLYDGTNTFSQVYTQLPDDPNLASVFQSIAESFDKL